MATTRLFSASNQANQSHVSTIVIETRPRWPCFFHCFETLRLHNRTFDWLPIDDYLSAQSKHSLWYTVPTEKVCLSAPPVRFSTLLVCTTCKFRKINCTNFHICIIAYNTCSFCDATYIYQYIIDTVKKVNCTSL